jgi:DNA-binding MarR family transcriptional regulator
LLFFLFPSLRKRQDIPRLAEESQTYKIARVLGLTPATVTTALQRLAVAGMIAIKEHESDTETG